MNLPTSPVLTGRRLGAYEVQDPIGSGAMGVVYDAFDPVIQRTAENTLTIPVRAGERHAVDRDRVPLL